MNRLTGHAWGLHQLTGGELPAPCASFHWAVITHLIATGEERLLALSVVCNHPSETRKAERWICQKPAGRSRSAPLHKC